MAELIDHEMTVDIGGILQDITVPAIVISDTPRRTYILAFLPFNVQVCDMTGNMASVAYLSIEKEVEQTPLERRATLAARGRQPAKNFHEQGFVPAARNLNDLNQRTKQDPTRINSETGFVPRDVHSEPEYSPEDQAEDDTHTGFIAPSDAALSDN